MCSCEIHKRLYLRNCHVSSLSSYDGCTTWNIETLWPPAEFWRRSSCACMAHRVKKITSQTFLHHAGFACHAPLSCWAKYSLTCAFWIDLVCYLPWKFHLVCWVVQRIHVGLSAVKQKLARKKIRCDQRRVTCGCSAGGHSKIGTHHQKLRLWVQRFIKQKW